MSNALKMGKSGLIYANQIDSAKTYCTSNYGLEWELDLQEVKILEVPFYQGRCIHKKYSGNNNQCCDGFLVKDNMFGASGAIGTSKIICPPESNNILICNTTNRKDTCYDQILTGSLDKYCSSFLVEPGNNLELLKKTLIDNFISDYLENKGTYVKYKNFIDNFIKLSVVTNLDLIVKDAYNLESAKNDLTKLTIQFNQKVSDLNKKDSELNSIKIDLNTKQQILDEKNILIKQRDDEILSKQRLLDEKTKLLDQKINEFNIKDRDLMNIQSTLKIKQSDFDRISGALTALEDQNKIMEASLSTKNALIANVNKNIQETEFKLQDYIKQRDLLNKELNDTKEKTDSDIKLAQDNYRLELNKLQQQERDARVKLENDLAAQKKKDIEELTKVMQDRETELQKNFAVLKDSFVKAEENNKTQTKKLMDDLDVQKKLSEQTIKNYNQQILDKQNELDITKKQKDDEIFKIQKQTSDSIQKIRADNEKESADLIKKLQNEKEKSLKEITDVYNTREKEINDRLNFIQAQMLKAEQDNKQKIQKLMDEYENKKSEYEKILVEEYKKKDEDYKKIADNREKEYQSALLKLQEDNKKQTNQLNELFKKELADINEQKVKMQSQFDEFKKKSESDIALLTTKLNEERAIYNKEIDRLNSLVKLKEEEAKRKLLEIQLSLQNDIDGLNATHELKKDLLFEQTNKQINMALEELDSKKAGINKSFQEELKNKQTDLDSALLAQKDDYVKRLTVLQESNNQMVTKLEVMTKTFKIAQEEQATRLDNLTETKQKEYIQIQQEYEFKAKTEQAKFEQIVKNMEQAKFDTIKKFTQETEKELLHLNLIVDEQRIQNQIESDKKREELKAVIIKLDDEKIRLVNEKNEETKKALGKIQQIYDSQVEEIKIKIEEYNKTKENYDNKIKDEMNLFEKQMSNLEIQKLKRVGEYTKYTQDEIAIMGKTLEEEQQKSIVDGIKYRKILVETIDELDKERMEIIKKKNDETKKILEKIKQEYEVEASSVNQSIKEYNDKKKEYDNNIKQIDEEQTQYVAKKRAEAEQELGKLSKILSDEISDLKNKIETYKIQREEKLNEINKLNEQLVELQNRKVIEEKKTYSLNQYVLWGSIAMFVVLLTIIFLQYRNQLSK